MSLILAHHTPKGAVVVSDTQWHGDPAGMAHFAPKIHRVGEWIVGFVGSRMPAQLVLRALTHASGNLDAPEPALLAAFKDVVPLCGPTEPHNFPSTGCDVVIVSKDGIVCMDAHGTIRYGGEFLALGCGEQYAQGWWDRYQQADAYAAVDHDEVEMTRCMGAAKHHFPGIGGETTVLRLAWE